MYSSDFWVSVLACADRFQFRNPTNGISTSLTSYSAITENIGSLQLTKLQEATMLSLYYTMGSAITYYSVHSRGADSLRASDIVSGTTLSHPASLTTNGRLKPQRCSPSQWRSSSKRLLAMLLVLPTSTKVYPLCKATKICASDKRSAV